ncbi:hypothetical protein [Thalassospira xiamenensis]|nr:hypothetical protein [Thalassospira xiamenensis]
MYNVEDLLEDAIKDPELFHWTDAKPETIVRQQVKAIMRALELNGFGIVANLGQSD